MTKRQRSQVVELLRCAADECNHNHFPRLAALYAFGLDTDSPQYDAMVLACEHVGGRNDQRQLLEAAARVEEGSYP
jgi:hypothetical protein